MSARRPSMVDSRGRHTPDAEGAIAPGSESPAGSRFASPITARRMALMQEPVLVLNATYEPINVTGVRRAMVLILKGGAKAEKLTRKYMGGANILRPNTTKLSIPLRGHTPGGS